jgi:hypothetical protein
MTNPLIEKYNEIHKKEEPKPTTVSHCSKTEHDRRRFLVAEVEHLLQDLRSGRAIITSSERKAGYNHLAAPLPCSSLPSSEFLMNYPLPIDHGDLITLTIFRKY